MTSVSNITKERRSGTQEMVAKLTAERAQMWVLYCQVAGLKGFVGDKPIPVLLQDFCQILIDYIASGHFALYERIANGVERRKQVADLASQLYARIAQSTQVALNFNDKYDSEEHCEQIETLSQDLSTLGEELAVRIELEDKLIEALKVN
jgi:regulator of sigma D